MTTVNYLNKQEMGNKFGMPNALGYTQKGKIYIRKGLDKATEMKVREHEADHAMKGEEGPSLFSDLLPVAGAGVGFLVGGPAGAAIGASIGSGISGNIAAGDAAETTANASNYAADLQYRAYQDALREQQRQYDLTRSDTAPYRDVGYGATNYLASLLLPQQYRPAPQAAPATPPAVQPAQPTSASGVRTVSNALVNSPGLMEAIQNAAPGGTWEDLLPKSGLTGTRFTTMPVKMADPDHYTLNAPDRTGKVPGVTYNTTPSTGVTVLPAADRYASGQSLQYPNQSTGQGNPTMYPTGFDPGDFEASPDYQFRIDQGAQGIQNYLGANRMRLSGAALKEMERFRQGLAGSEYGNWWNRQLGTHQQNQQDTQNYLSRVFQLSGYGPGAVNTAVTAGTNAANQMGAAGSNYAANVGNLATNQANTAAGLRLGASANTNNAITSGVGNYLTYRQNQDMMDLFRQANLNNDVNDLVYGSGLY